MKIIILNPKEAERLDWEHKWKDLISFQSYLSMKAQVATYSVNSKGYERAKHIKESDESGHCVYMRSRK